MSLLSMLSRVSPYFVLAIAGTLSACDSGKNTSAQGTAVDGMSTVKAFVKDFRTWGNVINEQASGKASEFGNQVADASLALEGSTQIVLQPVFTAAVHAINSKITEVNGTQTSNRLVDYGVGFSDGSIVRTNNEIVLSRGIIADSEISMTVRFGATPSNPNSMQFGIASASVRNSAIDANITSGLLTFEVVDPSLQPNRFKNISANFHGSITQKKNSLGTNLPHQVTLSGDFVVDVFPLQDSAGAPIGAIPKHYETTGIISTSSGNSFKISTVFDSANASSLALSNTGTKFVETENHWLKGSGYTAYELQLSNLPKAMIKLSTERKGYRTAATELQIAYGTRKIVASYEYTLKNVTGPSANPISNGTGVVNITNQDGVTVSIQPNISGDNSADIRLNGTTYAVLTVSEGLVKVSYIDGTFEIF